MSISDYPVIPSTTTGHCPLCGAAIPTKGYHVCSAGTKVIDRNHMQQPSSSTDEKILAELKEIKKLLIEIVDCTPLIE